MNQNFRSARRLGLAALLSVLAFGALPVPAQDGVLPDKSAGAAAAADDDRDDVNDGPGFGPGFGPGGGERFAGRMARRLDLSDAQQEAIAKIHEAGRDRDLPLRKQMRQLRHELQGEMMKDEPSEKSVLALSARLGDLRTKMQNGRLSDRLEVRALLTAEQRDKMMMGAFEGGRRGARGPRDGHLRGGRGGNGRCDVQACDGNGPGRGRQSEGRRGPRWQEDRDAD